jgi:hypothetical protein
MQFLNGIFTLSLYEQDLCGVVSGDNRDYIIIFLIIVGILKGKFLREGFRILFGF